MGSTRLPGKVLLPLAGRPLLSYILERIEKELRHPATVVVAMSTSPKDDAIAAHCRNLGAEFFRGSEDNVLERFYLCARKYRFDHVVRLTGDNPFPDIEELDRLIELHHASSAQFTHSFSALPLGVGCEIFTFDALAIAFHKAHSPHHFEHVDEYLLEHPEEFKTVKLDVPYSKRRPDVRLTVDYELDYQRACFIAERGHEYVTTEQAISLCSRFA